MPWWIWIAAGILLMIIEIMTPGFIFFSIGIGAIVAGLLGFLNLPAQLLVFVVTSLVSFLLMKKFAKFLLRPTNVDTNIFALIGKTGIVTQTIFPLKKGYVKIEGEEWSAVAEDHDEAINEDTMVEIVKTEGNKVIVKKKG